MQNDRTYRQRRENIGPMRDIVTIYTPVVTRTASGGQRTQWVEWRETRAAVENQRGTEAVDADRPVAVNQKRFTMRTGSIPDVNETMMIGLDGQYYMIDRIDHREDLPHKMYREITATRRDTSVQPVEFLSNAMYMDFAQRFTNITAAYVTVSAGTLLATADNTEAQINQRLFVFRGGLRLTYGSSADDGYTITNATNRITPNLPLSGENVLVHQYQVT